jgi:hypothetical protein
VNVFVGGYNSRVIRGNFDGTLAIDLSLLSDITSPKNVTITFNVSAWDAGDFAGTLSDFRFIDDSSVPTEWLQNLEPSDNSSAVPEPTTLLLFLAGTLGLGFTRRKRITGATS